MPEAEPGRVLRVRAACAEQPPGRPELRLCSAAAKLLDAAGAGLSLSASDEPGDAGLWMLCATDRGHPGEMVQFDLGEGPSYTAQRTCWPVQVPDIERDDTWPAFARAASAVGLRAVFAFPLPCGPGSLGVLTLYQHVAGELTSEQYADALAVARVAADLLTSRHGGPVVELAPVFADGMASTDRISQASGVVSVQLGIPVEAALAVLRAHGFAEERGLADVATQVIEHRLTLSPLHD